MKELFEFEFIYGPLASLAQADVEVMSKFVSVN